MVWTESATVTTIKLLIASMREVEMIVLFFG